MSRILKYLSGRTGTSCEGVYGKIIETKGSAPQVPGAGAIFRHGEIMAGTLGGGVLEFEAANRASSIEETGTSITFIYDLNADISESKGAICGGKVVVLLDANFVKDKELFEEVENELLNSASGIFLTIVEMQDRERVGITRKWIREDEIKNMKAEDKNLPGVMDIQMAFDKRQPLLAREGNLMFFIEPLFPFPELVIIGAGHIGRALSHLGSLLDFSVTIVDDRPQFASRERFPDADRIVVDNTENAFSNLVISRDTYIVIMTPGHTGDSIALQKCISSDAGYIGMIGSKRKIGLMKQEFIKNKWATEEQFSRVHAPVGLPIPSRTVEEIAVSIAAELIMTRNSAVDMNKRLKISSVILAAGESSRMKKQKLLLEYDKRSIIEAVVSESVDSGVDSTLVVMGANHKEIEDKLKNYNIERVYNEEYSKGMLSSVQKGISSLTPDISAAIIMLGDQPMIRSSVTNKLIKTYITKSAGIVIPVNNGRRGHPLLIDRKYFHEILELTGEESLRNIISNHRDDICEVEVDTSSILRDIDTKEQYEYEINNPSDE